MIERVEIIRGPGSARYGGFAEVATINVITHRGANLDGMRVDAEAGALGEGVFLVQSNLERQDNICVIGNGVKEKLFHYEDPLGKQIKLDNQWFTVVGVMEKQLSQTKKIENLQLRNLNMDVYLPLTTAQYKMERTKAATGPSSVTFGDTTLWDADGPRE